MSKGDPRTTSHAATTIIEGAESLVSLHPQAATSVDDTEEDLENVQAQRSRNRGKPQESFFVECSDLYLRPKEETE
jgi:hypothetical protein